MDPNATLDAARKALAEYRTAQGQEYSVLEAQRHAESLADAFEALDAWLSRGGFIPAEWADTER